MRRIAARTAATPLGLSALGALALPFVLVACGGSTSDSGGSSSASSERRTVDVMITEAGCEPAALKLHAGPTTFKVRNDGATRVTEFEVLDGDHILGEAENIAAGLSGQFSVTLQPGSYTTYCPGGTTTERGTLKVTGSGTATPTAAAAQAVTDYRAYVESQTAQLVEATKAFVDAVKAGDVERAKALYAPARVPYERIEPVAESFGDLDPRIDAREGDVPQATWTGFHPLEKALWVNGSLAGTKGLADGLLRDVKRLQTLAQSVELEAAQIANGSVELLGEVSKSKITGEEERYSRIDLVDFAANVDGARAAFNAVRPIVQASDPDLATTIDGRFDDVYAALEEYREGDGYVSYPKLTPADTRKLSQAIDALAEPLSGVGAIVVAASTTK